MAVSRGRSSAAADAEDHELRERVDKARAESEARNVLKRRSRYPEVAGLDAFRP